MLTLAVLLWSWVAAAAPELPPELEGWKDWVAEDDWACATDVHGVVCVWPGRFVLDAGPTGASARLDVRVDRAEPVPLPGGPGTWPQGLRVDGRPVAVRDVNNVPTVDLPAGTHVVTWSVPWPALPPTFPVAGRASLVALTLDGTVVSFPLVDGQGQLRLGSGDPVVAEADRLEVEVFRRVDDDVPVGVTTQLVLRASGAPREVDLGAVLPEGLRTVALAADLPARLTPEATLAVQVRPGTFRVELEAIALTPVTALAAPALPAPWPAFETWSVQTNDLVRTVNLTGAPGVEPARTAMPDDWKYLPAFQVTPGTPLVFEELRRGAPEPPVNELTAHRELWLDLDGGGLTVRDRVTGRMSRGWRLDVMSPLALGHAALGGVDQVITTREGRIGVEVRSRAVDLVAESRIEGDPRHFAAVGWATDVQSLSATLHVPPGWELLWARGVDQVEGLAPWSLFDLFYVLVVALAFSRVLGWRWGALALAALVVSRHVDGAPDWTWAMLVVVVAIERAVAQPIVKRALGAVRIVLLVGLFAILVPFAVGQVRDGLFPQLTRPGETASSIFGSDLTVQAEPEEAAQDGSGENLGSVSTVEVIRGGEIRRDRPAESAKSGYQSPSVDPADLSRQIDPAATVQTGPGVPSWSWNRYDLAWSGPVGAGHEVGLVLLGPGARLVLALLRVAMLLALALRLTGLTRAPLRSAGPAAAAALALLVTTPTAQATPTPEILAELAERIGPDRSCQPACAAAPSARISVDGDRLRVELEVHAATAAAWRLPGPLATWAPTTVTLDGQPAALAAKQGHAQVRVPAGVHRVVAEGPLPEKDVVTLGFLDTPKRVTFASTSWRIDGLKADGTPGTAIDLVRLVARPGEAKGGEEGASVENLAPHVEIRRFLDLGLPWKVRTEVVRHSRSAQPLALRVPLLPGETVNGVEVEVEDGFAIVGFARDQTAISWNSSLESTSPVVLTAPENVPWTEQWTVSCSPIYACAASGLAPLGHIDGERGVWAPTWRPWPGESVTVEVTRPEGVPGRTLTIDQATFRWSPGLRLGAGKLFLTVRTSQGGQLPLTLPEGAELREVIVGSGPKPLQLRDDRVLPVPLQPGKNEIWVIWQQDHAFTLVDTVPSVGLGAPAVNADVTVELPPSRWILALRGPAWGPVPLYWVYLGLVLIAAPLLRRIPFTPLTTGQWALLGLGLTQVPVFVPLFLVLVFVALGARGAHPPKAWWAFDLVQLVFVPVLLVALGSLYAAIHAGLLVQPDLQVEGNGSSDTRLSWYADRVDGALPTPSIVSVPLWTFRVAMLLWSLWLAAFLVRQARWAWGCLTAGGLFLPPPRRAPAPPPTPPAAG